MNLATIEMERPKARQAFLDYRHAVLERPRAARDAIEREYEEIDRAVMRGYRELARGHQLIELTSAIAAGGTTTLDVPRTRWNQGSQVRVTVAVEAPRIAIVRADARTCWTKGIDRDGAVAFQAEEWAWHPRKANHATFPAGTFDADETRLADHARTTLRAIVPTIPPPFRPPHKLGNYHLLFEAEWNAAAPVDPALLKHLGGDLYAVLAVWDLTELERAVLGGRARS